MRCIDTKLAQKKAFLLKLTVSLGKLEIMDSIEVSRFNEIAVFSFPFEKEETNQIPYPHQVANKMIQL